jgi:hypothetical protein
LPYKRTSTPLTEPDVRISRIQARIPQGDGWAGKRVLQTQLPLAESDILHVDIPLKSPKNLASISGTIKWIGEKRPRYINIRGRVLDKDGRPIDNATVSLVRRPP